MGTHEGARTSSGATWESAGAGDDRVDTLVAGWNLLKRRAARLIAALPAVPSAGALDAAQRDLRWASLLQQTLVATSLREAVRRADLWAGRRIDDLPAELLRELLGLLVRVCTETIDRVDPSRGNRLDRLVALEVDKALASRGPDRAAMGRDGMVRPRAAAGRARGSVAVPGLFDSLSPWQAWLGPPINWRARIGALPQVEARAVTLAHGLDGSAPRTLREAGRTLGASPSVVARWLADAEAHLRRGPRSTP